jgi:dihydroflavonol-4-reductase
MAETVLLTGSTGFVGSHVMKLLIEKGYNVRAAIRSTKDHAKYDYLYEVCGDHDRTRIQFVEAELESKPEAWDAAAEGCSACIHCASPVKLWVKDFDKELKNPIFSGIENIFGACQRSGTVKRVVYTSSMTAMSDDFGEWRKHPYGPNDWNKRSSATHNQYSYVKTIAEKKAIDFVKEQKAFSLATVLPGGICGPLLNNKQQHLPDVMLIPMKDALNGKMYLVNYYFPLVDVRDVALIHVTALERLPADPSLQMEIPRFVASHDAIHYRKMLKELGTAVPERKKKLPKHTIPDLFVTTWAKVMMNKGDYIFVKTTLEEAPKYDCSLAEKELGIRLRPWEDTVRDCALYLKEAGFLK